MGLPILEGVCSFRTATLSYGTDPIVPDRYSVSPVKSTDRPDSRFEYLDEREPDPLLAAPNDSGVSARRSGWRSLCSFLPKNDFDGLSDVMTAFPANHEAGPSPLWLARISGVIKKDQTVGLIDRAGSFYKSERVNEWVSDRKGEREGAEVGRLFG